MRKLFLLFTILFMAACQQEDIFIEDAMPLDDSGAISVITKKSGITSKSSTGDLDKDLPSFDDYYAPAVYAYPVEHFVDLRSSLNDAIQFYVDYAAYVQPTDDFDAYQDNVCLLQTELNKMEGAVVDELTLRNIFLEVLAAITPIVEAQNAILLKHAPSYLDAPTYLEIDSEDSVDERYRERDKNEATNIHFVGSIIDVNEWKDANGVIYRAFHYRQVVDGRTRTYEEGYNELTYIMFNGYDPSQVEVFWFRGIIYKRGDLQNTLHYTSDPNEYSPIANKCNQYYGATRITQGSPSLLEIINQDRQKIKFWGGSTNKEVIKESVGLKTLHSPKETKDTCGVSFDGEDGGEWGSRGTKFAIPASHLTGKGEVPEASMGDFSTLPQFESVEVLISGASASWEINQTESIYFSTHKEGNNYINDITMYFSEPVDQEFLRMVFNQDVLTNIAFKYHGGEYPGLPDTAYKAELEDKTVIGFTAVGGQKIEVILWKVNHFPQEVAVDFHNGFNQDLKLVRLDVRNLSNNVDQDLIHSDNVQLKNGQQYQVRLRTKYRNDQPKWTFRYFTYNGEGTLRVDIDNYNDSISEFYVELY